LKFIECPTVTGSKTTKGSGGLAFISGLSSYIEINYAAAPAAATFTTIVAANHGGMFYSLTSSTSVLGCELYLKNTLIDTTQAVAG
jgi:hypothetical protein